MSLTVYKASAGSGKTFKLALEYIALALIGGNPSDFSKILAVTFTNKATTEMKERILSQLYKLACGIEDKNFERLLQERTGLSVNVLRERAGRTLRCIIHDYDRFRVETIDSFFQSLLTNLAHELGLSRGFRVNLDTNDAVSRAVDRMLLSIGIKGKAANNLRNFILQYMEENIDDDKGWNISSQLKAFSQKNLFRDEYVSQETKLAKVIEDPKKLESNKRELESTIREGKECIQAPAMRVKEVLTQPCGTADPTNIKAYKSILNYANTLLSGDYCIDSLPTALTNGIENPMAFLNKALQKDDDYVQLATRLQEAIKQCEEVRLKYSTVLITAQLILANRAPLCLLKSVGNEVNDLCRETGTFMLAKTADFFNKMVNSDDSSFVFERAGNTFNHILIDEFQDTSHQQWDNFKMLLIEMAAQSHDCLLVGDIKQSIYRWRGGDWKILGGFNDANATEDTAQQQSLCPLNAPYEVKTLKENYRSDGNIVEFNNDFFIRAAHYLDFDNAENCLDEENTISTIYKEEDTAQEVKKNPGKGYVRIATTKAKLENEEVLDEMYEQICRLHNDYGLPYEEMAILVRRNKEAKAIIEYFSTYRKDIPVTSDEAFSLSASPAVTALISAIKYLASPEDTVSLHLCARSLSLLRKNENDRPLPETLQLVEELKTRKEEWAALPLYELCKKLMDFFDLPAVEAQDGGQSAYLFSFLDHVLAYLDDNPSDLAAFADYWDNTLSTKAIATDTSGSIYILSVHKSKGLERHTVFIPFCNWPLDQDHQGDILWCPTEGLPEPFADIPLAPVNSYGKKRIALSVFAPYYNREHLMQRIDSINELYVAFTRPRHNLFIWAMAKTNTVQGIVQNYVNQALGIEEDKARKKSKKTATQAEEDVWTLYEIGNPVGPDIPKTEGKDGNDVAEVKAQPADPFDTKHAGSETVKLSQISELVEFKQSNKARDFISALQAEDEAEAANSVTDEANDTAAETSTAATQAKAQKQTDYIDQGKLLHRLFSLISKADDLENATQYLLRQGIIADSAEADKVSKLAARLLSRPQVAPWFDGSWTVHAECNLLLKDEHGELKTCRPDRVMTRKDDTVVIDYKFGRHNEEYVDQVRRYMDALRQMGYPNVRGYLFYGYSGKVYEV